VSRNASAGKHHAIDWQARLRSKRLKEVKHKRQTVPHSERQFVGGCSRWTEGGAMGYETGSVQTDSSALVLLELQRWRQGVGIVTYSYLNGDQCETCLLYVRRRRRRSVNVCGCHVGWFRYLIFINIY